MRRASSGMTTDSVSPSGTGNTGRVSYWIPTTALTMAALLVVMLFGLVIIMLSARQQLLLRQTATSVETSTVSHPTETSGDATEKQLSALEASLKLRETEISAMETQLLADQERFASERDALLQRESMLEEMAARKAQIAAELRDQLARAGVEAEFDPLFSNVRFGQAVLFEENKFVLSDQGKQFLRAFFPVYLDVLLSDAHKDEIREIQIVGHADDGGAFGHNLELSQNRAAAVATFLVEAGLLKTANGKDAAALLTIAGRSYNEPVLVDGVSNKELSRRVEVKFRLAGEELVTHVELGE